MPEFVATEEAAADAALRATTLPGLFTAMHRLTHLLHAGSERTPSSFRNEGDCDEHETVQASIRARRDLIEVEVARRIIAAHAEGAAGRVSPVTDGSLADLA